MIKGKRLSFAHLEGDICVYNLTKGDKEYLKSNGLKKVPAILQSVEFGSLGKLIRASGFKMIWEALSSSIRIIPKIQ